MIKLIKLNLKTNLIFMTLVFRSLSCIHDMRQNFSVQNMICEITETLKIMCKKVITNNDITSLYVGIMHMTAYVFCNTCVLYL